MYGAGFGDTYEDELYREDPSVEEDSASDAIDSDTEEKILSHIYYQSNTAAPTPTQQTKSPLARTRIEADDSDSSESKYQIEKKRRKVHSSADFIKPREASDEESISVTVVKPYRSATVSDEENGPAVSIRDVSFNTQDDMAVDSYLDSVTSTGLATPVRHPEGEAMEHHHIQIDSLQLTSPGISTHPVLVRAGDPDDDEYGYLDEAEIQGRNRYFMEEKEIICRKCHRPGHMAKACTTMTCMTCGKDGHLSKDCKQTGNVCYVCNMRGHISSECPQRSGAPRARGCDRCNSRTHHTEECTTIWRRYVYTSPRPEHSDVIAWCYNCAARGHFGDDCQMPRSQGALAYQGDTAFGSANCPGKMIHVSESQRPAHFDSSRLNSGSHDGHQNREDRRREHGYGPRRPHAGGQESRSGSRHTSGSHHTSGGHHDSRSGSRHHQNSSGNNSASSSANRRPNRDYANRDYANSASKSGRSTGGGYHSRPQQTPTAAVRGQHRRY
ncbi:hypothetical protein LPJ71_008662 [Coemansia sp. S17]|nr:hypothetical protein LPJ71_008662 [Coemansia sp. S17]